MNTDEWFWVANETQHALFYKAREDKPIRVLVVKAQKHAMTGRTYAEVYPDTPEAANAFKPVGMMFDTIVLAVRKCAELAAQLVPGTAPLEQTPESIPSSRGAELLASTVAEPEPEPEPECRDADIVAEQTTLGRRPSWAAELRHISRDDLCPNLKAELRAKDPAVNHPAHYNTGKFEVVDVIEDWKLDFNLGNAVKYIARSPHKGTEAQDLRKAIWYLNRKLKSLE